MKNSNYVFWATVLLILIALIIYDYLIYLVYLQHHIAVNSAR